MKIYKAKLFRPKTGSYCNWECKANDVEVAVKKLQEEMCGWLFQEIEEHEEVKRKKKE